MLMTLDFSRADIFALKNRDTFWRFGLGHGPDSCAMHVAHRMTRRRMRPSKGGVASHQPYGAVCSWLMLIDKTPVSCDPDSRPCPVHRNASESCLSARPVDTRSRCEVNVSSDTRPFTPLLFAVFASAPSNSKRSSSPFRIFGPTYFKKCPMHCWSLFERSALSKTVGFACLCELLSLD
jgi:hypothetical protein